MRGNDSNNSDGKLTAVLPSRRPKGLRLSHLLSKRSLFLGAPLLIAFIAAAANAGEPERVFGLIAALGITLHIGGLRAYRRKLRRTLEKAALHSPDKDLQLQASVDDLRQWHLSQAYLLGALKIRATDDATRQLAAEAEDAAQGALAIVDRMTAVAKPTQPDETAAQRQVA